MIIDIDNVIVLVNKLLKISILNVKNLFDKSIIIAVNMIEISILKNIFMRNIHIIFFLLNPNKFKTLKNAICFSNQYLR